jgi:hypothetical protein
MQIARRLGNDEITGFNCGKPPLYDFLMHLL